VQEKEVGSKMVITILEAQVAADKIGILERTYREMTSAAPPAGLMETFLTRETQDGSLFQIMTMWTSREALDQMRASVDKPGGVLIFEAAGELVFMGQDLTGEGMIAGVLVRCISPALQMSLHSGYDLPPKQSRDLDLLRSRLGAHSKTRL
jgi:hypothetical protein